MLYGTTYFVRFHFWKGMEEKENLANEILEPKTNPKNKPEEDVTRRADSVDSSFGSLGKELVILSFR